MPQIKIDDFTKCEIRVGTIVEASFVESADKLICFKVDLGESETDEQGTTSPKIRQILSGIREYYPDPLVLVGTQVPVLCNLPTRRLKGLDSEGMILYTVGTGDNFCALHPDKPVTPGTEVR